MLSLFFTLTIVLDIHLDRMADPLRSRVEKGDDRADEVINDSEAELKHEPYRFQSPIEELVGVRHPLADPGK